jgi:PAS domain S-box-containing protein
MGLRCSLTETCFGDDCCALNALIYEEPARVRRLVRLVGRLFAAPASYLAMLGRQSVVVSRIGKSAGSWKPLSMVSIERLLTSPLVLREVDSESKQQGRRSIQFIASVPIRTMCARPLGLLVIADHLPRLAFSEANLRDLVQLAGVISSTIAQTTAAHTLLETQMRLSVAEDRFRQLANSVSTLISCQGGYGSCTFVNDAWLKFTGRSMADELDDGWTAMIPRAYRNALLVRYWERLQNRQAFTLDLPLHRYDGDCRWFSARAAPSPVSGHNTMLSWIVCLSEQSRDTDMDSDKALPDNRLLPFTRIQ